MPWDRARRSLPLPCRQYIPGAGSRTCWRNGQAALPVSFHVEQSPSFPRLASVGCGTSGPLFAFLYFLVPLCRLPFQRMRLTKEGPRCPCYTFPMPRTEPRVTSQSRTCESHLLVTIPAASNIRPSYIFKNIRYAAPPVGDLRWAKPAPPQNSTTIQDGSYGNKCVQAAIKGLNLVGAGNASPVGAAVNQL